MQYEQSEEFNKDLKKLLKRYKSLSEDIEVFKKYAIEPYYEKNINTNSFVKIEGRCGERYDSLKVKKFACKSLKTFGNRSGIRIIFVFDKIKKKISFVEIYHKSDKENEDSERLKKKLQILEKGEKKDEKN